MQVNKAPLSTFKHQSHKMDKHTQTIDHFVILALKGLISKISENRDLELSATVFISPHFSFR